MPKRKNHAENSAVAIKASADELEAIILSALRPESRANPVLRANLKAKMTDLVYWALAHSFSVNTSGKSSGLSKAVKSRRGEPEIGRLHKPRKVAS